MSNINDAHVLNILSSILGEYKHTTNDDYAFKCPFCGKITYKKKLEIDIHTGKWHCWVCNMKGTSIFQLLRKLRVSNGIINDISKYIRDIDYIFNDTDNKDKHITDLIYDKLNTVMHNQQQVSEYIIPGVVLPDEFRPLFIKNNASFEYNNAIAYLSHRNITLKQIIRYNIGYCESGRYEKRIIIPSYDDHGFLNYFTARAYYINNSYRYMNPTASRDIIPFDLYINWKKPIILCEGFFDAIAIGDNAIPLLGKSITPKLKRKIIDNHVTDIYICLDNDAKKQSLKYCENLLLGNDLLVDNKNIYLVQLNGKDPSEIGHDNIRNIINNTEPLTFEQLVKNKLQ